VGQKRPVDTILPSKPIGAKMSEQIIRLTMGLRSSDWILRDHRDGVRSLRPLTEETTPLNSSEGIVIGYGADGGIRRRTNDMTWKQ
jgi:hypothetical protein